MRPLLVEWLRAHGLPDWLAPDYAIAVGVAALLLGATNLALTRRDGDDVPTAARALVAAYLGALGGGYVFEFFRVLPTTLPHAVASGSLVPLFNVGRAAYGGLLGGVALPWIFLRAVGAPVAPFLDRVAFGTGMTFFFVRLGCLLEGCDFGTPTASWVGVRFPPGSAGAVDHAWRGWVQVGAASLPVHPTQIYEALVGLLAAVASWQVLRRQALRDGAAFATFLAVYAVGRFAVEFWRGDVTRGVYLGLSSSQLVSVVLLAAVVRFVSRLQRPSARTAASTASA